MHALLESYCKLHCIDCARKFHEHAIAHEFYNPTVMFADERIQDVSAASLEGGQMCQPRRLP
jgi:hypothetical protein